MQEIQHQRVKSTSSIDPNMLTPRELLHYAELEMDHNGLPEKWCKALLAVLAAHLNTRR